MRAAIKSAATGEKNIQKILEATKNKRDSPIASV